LRNGKNLSKGIRLSMVSKTTKIIYNVAPIGPTISNPLKKILRKD
jgi:hypothetical protein